MREIKGRFRYHAGTAGVVLTGLCMVFTPAFSQDSPGQGKAPVPIVGGFDKLQALPPGGPAPRMADGHVDLTGRYYPNNAGRMLEHAYPVDELVFRQFNAKVTPE